MMKSKKIKIVDITADDDTVEEIKPVSANIIKEEASEQLIELKQIVKTTNLTECPKCHKMLTNKSINKYPRKDMRNCQLTS